ADVAVDAQLDAAGDAHAECHGGIHRRLVGEEEHRHASADVRTQPAGHEPHAHAGVAAPVLRLEPRELELDAVERRHRDAEPTGEAAALAVDANDAEDARRDASLV